MLEFFALSSSLNTHSHKYTFQFTHAEHPTSKPKILTFHFFFSFIIHRIKNSQTRNYYSFTFMNPENRSFMCIENQWLWWRWWWSKIKVKRYFFPKRYIIIHPIYFCHHQRQLYTAKPQNRTITGIFWEKRSECIEEMKCLKKEKRIMSFALFFVLCVFFIFFVLLVGQVKNVIDILISLKLE